MWLANENEKHFSQL